MKAAADTDPDSPMQTPPSPTQRLAAVRASISNAEADCARTGAVQLLAVSKTHPAEAVRALAAAGQRAFGENYVQEALQKMQVLADLDLEWHLIGPLQSNKAKPAAEHFHWVHSLDRPKLVAALARHRPPGMAPLNVLVQVNIDGEDTKSGCNPDDVGTLAAAIAAEPTLRLRGLMAIPRPDPAARRRAFAALRNLFEGLQRDHPGVDTLSMGMSADFPEAIAEGSTLVRIGTALFGARA